MAAANGPATADGGTTPPSGQPIVASANLDDEWRQIEDDDWSSELVLSMDPGESRLTGITILGLNTKLSRTAAGSSTRTSRPLPTQGSPRLSKPNEYRARDATGSSKFLPLGKTQICA